MCGVATAPDFEMNEVSNLYKIHTNQVNRNVCSKGTSYEVSQQNCSGSLHSQILLLSPLFGFIHEKSIMKVGLRWNENNKHFKHEPSALQVSVTPSLDLLAPTQAGPLFSGDIPRAQLLYFSCVHTAV